MVIIIVIIIMIISSSSSNSIIGTLARSLHYTPEIGNRKSPSFHVNSIHIRACSIDILYSLKTNRKIFTSPQKSYTNTQTHTYLRANEKKTLTNPQLAVPATSESRLHVLSLISFPRSKWCEAAPSSCRGERKKHKRNLCSGLICLQVVYDMI